MKPSDKRVQSQLENKNPPDSQTKCVYRCEWRVCAAARTTLLVRGKFVGGRGGKKKDWDGRWEAGTGKISAEPRLCQDFDRDQFLLAMHGFNRDDANLKERM